MPTIARFIDIEAVRRAAARASARGRSASRRSPSPACSPSALERLPQLVAELGGPVAGRTAGRQGRRAGGARAGLPAADTGSGTSRRSAIASSSRGWPRTAARLSGARARQDATGAAARSIRAIDAARCSRASALVSSLQRQDEQRRAAEWEIADGAGLSTDRAAAAPERAARGPRARTAASAKASAATAAGQRGTSGTKASSSATSASAASGAADRGWPRQLDRLARTEQRDVASRDHGAHGRQPSAQGRLKPSCRRPQDFLKTARRAGTRRRAR